MQVNFTGHTVEVTPAIRSYTLEKFDRLEHHFERITSVNVIFDVEKLVQKAEATILVPKAEIHASSESENLYAAIDTLVDKLDRQLIKHKEKIRNNHNNRERIRDFEIYLENDEEL